MEKERHAVFLVTVSALTAGFWINSRLLRELLEQADKK